MEPCIDRAEQIAHATVVAAPSREESLRWASLLAAALVCQEDGPVPCGQCRACRKAEAGIHPDIIRVQRPLDDKGRPKKEIPVDTVRRMAADAPVLPNESERKVYLIEDADSMNTAAQNAALKLLEEPPAGGYFLLSVVNPALLLPTVRSRCATWSRQGEDQAVDPELGKLAGQFLHRVAEGDRAELLRWCVDNEDLDTRELRSLLEAAVACAADRLAGRDGNEGMAPAALLKLEELLERCLKMLQVNTGVKQIMGLLAVDAIAEDENRGVQH